MFLTLTFGIMILLYSLMLQNKRILPNNAVTAILNPFGYSLVEEFSLSAKKVV